MEGNIVPPALYDHCVSVFGAMRDEAQVDKLTTGSEEEGLVYEGFLTKLITEDVGLSVPYYTSVMRQLRRMGCVQQLRRGGSSTPSRWMLLEEPSLELFMSNKDKATTRLTSQSKNDVLEQRTSDLEERLTDVESQTDQLLAALVALDEMVVSLTETVSKTQSDE